VNLWDLANADNRAILENVSGGFGRSITLTDPSGTSAVLSGMGQDIGLTIDPQTGDAISGRRASAALPIAAILEAGLGQPVGVVDAASKPWLLAIQLPSEPAPRTFKIVETWPDRLGCIVCFLEAYST
jgi:hypothetical protein